MARTPSAPDSIADRNQYTYYNSATKSWQKNPLIKGDATGNLITWTVPLLVDGPKNGTLLGPNVGDVWFDNYHKTTMMVSLQICFDCRILTHWSSQMWNDAGIDATFWFRYEQLSSLCLKCTAFEKSLT